MKEEDVHEDTGAYDSHDRPEQASRESRQNIRVVVVGASHQGRPNLTDEKTCQRPENGRAPAHEEREEGEEIRPCCEPSNGC
jgi:hypothetical protein